MTEQQHNDPLHSVTLEMMLTQLVEHHGWEKMGQIIDIRCFTNDPSIKSSLQWALPTKTKILGIAACRALVSLLLWCAVRTLH